MDGKSQSIAIRVKTNVRAGQDPAMALANLFMATSQALSLAAQNATVAQQQQAITTQAVTTQGVESLYSLP